MSFILNSGQPPVKTILSAGVQGLLSAPASIAKICKNPEMADIEILTVDCAALNLNQAELFWAAFQLHDALLELNISPG